MTAGERFERAAKVALLPGSASRPDRRLEEMGDDAKQGEDGAGQLLLGAIVGAGKAAADAYLALGPIAVERFRLWLSGEQVITLPEGRQLEFIDNSITLSCRLAAAFPSEYLEAFSSETCQRSSFILAGLPYTRRPEAQKILVEALLSDAPDVVRLNAAAGLGTFPGAESLGALRRVADSKDEDSLVVYHAIRSLGAIGNRDDLKRLGRLAETSNRGLAEASRKAAASIQSRSE